MARKIKPVTDDQKYCSPRQAARILGVSEYLVYTGAVENRIPHRKLGKRILIPMEWVLGGDGGKAV